MSQMISLCRDPQGEKVFTNEDTTFSTLVDKNKIAQLEQEITSLKQQMKNPTSSIDVSKDNHYYYV